MDYIENVKLEKFFLAQKEKFEIEGKGKEEVLLWHGTNPSALEPILRDNFDIESAPVQPELGGGRDKKMLFGRGIYFSEVPTVSLMYGNTLILCRVVLGACQNFTPVAGHRVLTFSGLIFSSNPLLPITVLTAFTNKKQFLFQKSGSLKIAERSSFNYRKGFVSEPEQWTKLCEDKCSQRFQPALIRGR